MSRAHAAAYRRSRTDALAPKRPHRWATNLLDCIDLLPIVLHHLIHHDAHSAIGALIGSPADSLSDLAFPPLLLRGRALNFMRTCSAFANAVDTYASIYMRDMLCIPARSVDARLGDFAISVLDDFCTDDAREYAKELLREEEQRPFDGANLPTTAHRHGQLTGGLVAVTNHTLRAGERPRLRLLRPPTVCLLALCTEYPKMHKTSDGYSADQSMPDAHGAMWFDVWSVSCVLDARIFVRPPMGAEHSAFTRARRARRVAQRRRSAPRPLNSPEDDDEVQRDSYTDFLAIAPARHLDRDDDSLEPICDPSTDPVVAQRVLSAERKSKVIHVRSVDDARMRIAHLGKQIGEATTDRVHVIAHAPLLITKLPVRDSRGKVSYDVVTTVAESGIVFTVQLLDAKRRMRVEFGDQLYAHIGRDPTDIDAVVAESRLVRPGLLDSLRKLARRDDDRHLTREDAPPCRAWIDEGTGAWTGAWRNFTCTSDEELEGRAAAKRARRSIRQIAEQQQQLQQQEEVESPTPVPSSRSNRRDRRRPPSEPARRPASASGLDLLARAARIEGARPSSKPSP